MENKAVMEIHFRVSFFVSKNSEWHEFFKRNYRLKKYTINDDLDKLSRSFIKKHSNQYNNTDPSLNELTSDRFVCRTLSPEGRFEDVPSEDMKINFVDFVKKYEVENVKINKILVIKAEVYFKNKNSLEKHPALPHPAFR